MQERTSESLGLHSLDTRRSGKSDSPWLAWDSLRMTSLVGEPTKQGKRVRLTNWEPQVAPTHTGQAEEA